jgi:hypothetical protein
MTAGARPSARLADSSQKAIAGEWARAVIFEFAGGEPGLGEHVGLGDRRAPSQDIDTKFGEGPLSSVEFHRAATDSTDRQDAALIIGSGHDDTLEQQSQRAETQSAIAFYRTSRSDLFGSSNSGSPRSDSSLSAVDAPADGAAILRARSVDGATLVTEAAFDQMGPSRMAIVESSAASSRWTRYRGAAPLIMVLALERLASINSRHSAMESPSATPKKSQRLRILNKTDRK